MFPLGAVLLPGAELPLRIFEPRYRAMIERCLAGDGRFGVVMIARGSEVGGGDVRTEVGTVAQIDRYVRRGGGQFTLVGRGAERIRVKRWLPDDPYPMADTEPWSDEAQGPIDPTPLLDNRSELETLAERLARREGLLHRRWRAIALPDDSTDASYVLAQELPLADADRYRALCAPGPSDRLALLADALDDVIAGVRFRLQG